MSTAAAESAPAPAPVGNKGTHQNKRPRDSGKANQYKFKNKKKRERGGNAGAILKTQGTHEEVLAEDIRALLKLNLNSEQATNGDDEAAVVEEDQKSKLPEIHTELDLEIKVLSSTGDGLATYGDAKQVYVVPFSVPGDIIRARVFKHFHNEQYSMTDNLRVVTPSPQRDDSLIKCQYFSSCSGCQFQMLSYPDQLAHKRSIVERAYKNFSNLPPELIPTINDTIGSPLDYGYRTKLTPHFDGPPGFKRSDRRKGIKPKFQSVPEIGFMKKNTRHTIDIEDCPIGTSAVRLGMKSERKRVAEELDKYSRGATVLLRESTERISKEDLEKDSELKKTPSDAIDEELDNPQFIQRKTCITDQKALSTEYISDYQFVNPAGAFFQNNNSILPKFTQYVRDHIFPSSSSDTNAANGTSPTPKISNLIDAYSGSGLFTITLSNLFERSLGIDISEQSIDCANNNARLNNLPSTQASFMAADAANLFAKIDFPASETVVIIDPPRKGCDEPFLSQLLEFSPERVVYVSCNVHTQARDVGVLVGGMPGVDGGYGEGEGVYEIESLVGFDFFPQTGHVEGVAVLRKKSVSNDGGEEQTGKAE